MRFDVLSLFPEIIEKYCCNSIIGKGCKRDILQINTINPRKFASNKHKKVDDTPYGGGCGMLLMCQPFVDAFESIDKMNRNKVLMLSPRGKVFSQSEAVNLKNKYDQIILLCGHYEGFDERIKFLTNAQEVSVGDFVLTGGELGALIIIDSVSRLVDNVLGKKESFEDESFSEYLLEYSQYTKPQVYKKLEVPKVLTSGNHKEIYKYRRFEQLSKTKKLRPDLFKKFCEQSNLSKLDISLLKELEND